MKKNKMFVENWTLDAISRSTKLNISEKITLLKYIWYMNISERKELLRII